MKPSNLTPEERWYYAPLPVKIILRASIIFLLLAGMLESI